MHSLKYFSFFFLATLIAFGGGKLNQNFYSFQVNNIDDKPVDLKDFKGKVLLVVNVASRCGYTNQYEGMEKLYDTYKDKGFAVLGFPANNFGKQEPGTNAEIKTFCTSTYGVSFPMFAKISVKGDDIHPLYNFLTTSKKEFEGEISWNFNKFLIDQNGNIIARYPSSTEPMADEVLTDINKALAAVTR